MRPQAYVIFWIVLGSAVAGALYGYVSYATPGVGAMDGGANGAIFGSLEIFGFRGEAGAKLRRLPFLISLGVRVGIYVGLAVLLNAIALPLINGPALIGSINRADIAFALAACIVGNLFFGITELLGHGVLFAFVAGRYFRPRCEERALLYIDLSSSTAIAERLGDARFLDLLNAFFADVSLAVAEHGGEIHKYIGDEVIVTWRLKPGRNDAGIISACFGARDRLTAREDAYQREFGVRPDFRAALHAGALVVGELGSLKKEIALIGDAMNTAARILDACRHTAHPFLASVTLLDRLSGLPGATLLEPIAPLALRGKIERLELVALKRSDACR